jgi:hypothetical protein
MRHFQCGPYRIKESRRLVLPRTSYLNVHAVTQDIYRRKIAIVFLVWIRLQFAISETESVPYYLSIINANDLHLLKKRNVAIEIY